MPGQTYDFGTSGSSAVFDIDARAAGVAIPPGFFGYGAQWRKPDIERVTGSLGTITTNQQHASALATIKASYAPILSEIGCKRLSFFWGVGMGTFGHPLTSIGPWQSRTVDLNPPGGVNEKWIVGLGDIAPLCRAWGVEGITVAAPINGMNPIDKTISATARAECVKTAMSMVSTLSAADLNVHLGMGTEVSPLGIKATQAQSDQLALAKALRSALPSNVVLLLYVVQGARWSAAEAAKAMFVNKPLYDYSMSTPGVALDLHPYSSASKWSLDSLGVVAMNSTNIATLSEMGWQQRGYMRISASHWGAVGGFAPGVLAEWAVEGSRADKADETSTEQPFEVALAHCDILRESCASDVLASMKWSLTDPKPPEWRYGAVTSSRTASTHAKMLGFLAAYHRGRRIGDCRVGSLRACVSRRPDSPEPHVYGVNWSSLAVPLGFRVSNFSVNSAIVDYWTAAGLTENVPWNGGTAFSIPARSAWRIRLTNQESG